MHEKLRKLLVVDASVAGACGGVDACHPTSTRCRDFLMTFLSVCHRLIMSPEMSEEWEKHQSLFTYEWRASMVARKKMRLFDAPENEELWAKIEQTTQKESELESMEKDFHLIRAALATDKTVVSLDKTARRLFAKAAETVRELTEVVWVNPDQPGEGLLHWLEEGAKREKGRRLG